MSIDRGQGQGRPNVKFPMTIAQSRTELACSPAPQFAHHAHVHVNDTVSQASYTFPVLGLAGESTSALSESSRLDSYSAICREKSSMPCSDEQISRHESCLPWLSASSGTYLNSLNTQGHSKYSAQSDDVELVSNVHSFPKDLNLQQLENTDGLGHITKSKRLGSSTQDNLVKTEITSFSAFRSCTSNKLLKDDKHWDHSCDGQSPSLSGSSSRSRSPTEVADRNSVVAPSSTSDVVIEARHCDTTHINAGVRSDYCSTSRSADSHGNSTDADSSVAGMLVPTDIKVVPSESCPVCGDRVSGYHYGLLTCESCKGFFKRTVQNKKIYSCADSQACKIEKSQRKRCPSCRFQKCIQVGMKVEAVRTDRMRGGRNKFGPVYKRDRAMKLQAVHKYSPYVSRGQHVPPGDSSGSCDDDHKDIFRPMCKPDTQPKVNTALLGHARSVRVLPSIIQDLIDNEIDTNELVMFVQCQLESHSRVTTNFEQESLFCLTLNQMLLTLVEWLRSALYFKDISVDDQMKILQSTWSELAIMEILYSFLDEESWSWVFLRLCACKSDNDAQQVEPSFVSNIVSDVNKLVPKLHMLQFDNVDYSCMKYLIVLNPDTGHYQDRNFLVGTQDMISEALFDYSVNFFPHVPDKFGKLLLLLSEVRHIGLQLHGMLYQRLMDNDIDLNSLLAELLQVKIERP